MTALTEQFVLATNSRPARLDWDIAEMLLERAALMDRGQEVVSGGTDTSLLLLDLRPKGLTGNLACDRLEAAGLTCNKNAVPFDPLPPKVTSGLRLSSNAGTTRGLGPEAFALIGRLIAQVLDELAADPDGPAGPAIEAARAEIAQLCRRMPFYPSASGQ